MRKIKSVCFTGHRPGRLGGYDYLLRYLTDDELERVYSLPMRSKEQVDLIIKILDDYGACNDDLRKSA